jgi:citrate lyase subunit beta/citryl-CoA lyase
MLPKCEAAEQIEELAAQLGGGTCLIGLVETAIGVAKLDVIAKAKNLSRLALGAVDFGADVEADLDSATVVAAYTALVIHSRVAGLPAPIASPPLLLNDVTAVVDQARVLRGLGLGGQLCVHPRQVQPIHEGFAPTAHQLAWARRVMSTTSAATQVDGSMVDKPVRDRAARLLRTDARRQK